jgi:hypothetical protein
MEKATADGENVLRKGKNLVSQVLRVVVHFPGGRSAFAVSGRAPDASSIFDVEAVPIF